MLRGPFLFEVVIKQPTSFTFWQSFKCYLRERRKHLENYQTQLQQSFAVNSIFRATSMFQTDMMWKIPLNQGKIKKFAVERNRDPGLKKSD